MQPGIVDPGHQPQKGRWVMTQRTCHRPDVRQCAFLVVAIISCIVSRSWIVRTCRRCCSNGKNKRENTSMKYVRQLKGEHTYDICLCFRGLICFCFTMLSKCHDMVQRLLISEWWRPEYSVYIWIYWYWSGNASRYPTKSIIVYNTYQRVYHQGRHKFVCSVEQNERGGEVIERKEIVVEGKDVDNQVQGKMINTGRGY